MTKKTVKKVKNKQKQKPKSKPKKVVKKKQKEGKKVVNSKAGKQQGKNGRAVGYKNPPENTQFKPGQSGNPKGSATGKKQITIIKEFLNKNIKVPDPFEKNKDGTRPNLSLSINEALMLNLISQGLGKGRVSITAIKEILDRTSGKVSQNIKLDGDLNINENKKSKNELVERLSRLGSSSKKS